MPKDVVRDKRYDGVDRGRFLTGLGLVMEAHGISWDAVDVDVEKGVIDFKVDMKPKDIFKFLVDVQKTVGDFD